MNPDSVSMLGLNGTSNLAVAAIFGMIPFRIAVARHRLILGLAAFAGCLLAGLLGGAQFALPAAGVFAVVIVLVGPRSPAPAVGQYRYLQQSMAAAHEPALASANLEPYVHLEAGELALNCGQCGHAFGARALNLPPWCPRCGADLKKLQAKTPASS